MDNVSRPLLALLLGTVAFFALWIVALKPSSSSTSGASSSGSSGLGAYQSDINKAHQAVGTANAASAAQGTIPGTWTPTPAGVSARPASPAPKRSVPSRTHVADNPTARFNAVQRALLAHKVLAMLFYNPLGADDQAVKQELAAVPGHGGAVVKLEVPLSELAKYSVVTNQVMVTTSPTLVVIDPKQQASTLQGFADSLEIDQQIDDALAA